MSSVAKNARAYRQRKVGIKTVMPICLEKDIPDFDEEVSQQRTVPQVETGVEKEEEEEKHLQQVINAAHEAIIRGEAKKVVIPTREVKSIGVIDHYYKRNFICPKTLLRFSLTVEECISPVYCMDEQDQKFFDELKESQSSFTKFSETDFEWVIQILEDEIDEKQPFLNMDTSQILSLSELLPAFEERDLMNLKPLVTHVYPYWRERRIQSEGKRILLTAQVGDDKEDDDPYVCFRRREVRQARKTRRSDTQSMDRLRKLRFSMETSFQLLDQVWNREKLKLHGIQQDFSIFQHRCLVKRLKRSLNINDGDEDLINPKRRPIEPKPVAPIASPSPAPPARPAAHTPANRPAAPRTLEVKPLLMLDDMIASQITQFQIRLQERLNKKEQTDRNWVDVFENPSTVVPIDYPDSFYRNIHSQIVTGSPPQLSNPSNNAVLSSTPSSPSSETGPTWSPPTSLTSNSLLARPQSVSVKDSLHQYNHLVSARNPLCVRQRRGRGGRLMLDRTRALPIHKQRLPSNRFEDRWFFDIPFDPDDTVILDDDSDACISFRANLLAEHSTA
ncbi:NuA4 histone acetyltransferase complex Epl1 [Schizosaccharomyces cryophilus OY26]|uniref:Enhancer of polycomb-like protein n=1 Tax=Schizosaccharomyces cryophilus (strain OY26 / ATCC MYA-4695 / CBS 11777 / NBRC 106824 / NRRL Y48691) TaxID=653667 RepID=S9VY43_SCHCR|nr:NuA4 histone acetyltransferase complex Epl1 [Schizosaccharomyces cryophilus OY26]EPY51149.1 NuA4 histone acetyltransferase complex Epl1 [Schizosaccharomyces cryophilus OY26]